MTTKRILDVSNRSMYTGIVTHTLPISDIVEKPGLRRFAFVFPGELLNGLQIGASVSVSGVCLTVSSIAEDVVIFDAMQETLDKTTLGAVKIGDTVNILRSAKVGEEHGGHAMYGHVTGTAEIIKKETPENNCAMTFKVPTEWMKYIFQKGFIGLDGCSLTVTDPDAEAGTFTVWFIPETLEKTTFGKKTTGDKINLELDAQTQAIVETVERVLRERGET